MREIIFRGKRLDNGEITQDGEIAKMYKNICSGRCEVLGNIHDNPELLERRLE